jgi:ribosomal protein S6
MPLYNQLVMIVPKHPADQVAKCFQKYARTVLQMGGVVRTIENEGVRSLPERTQRSEKIHAIFQSD